MLALDRRCASVSLSTNWISSRATPPRGSTLKQQPRGTAVVVAVVVERESYQEGLAHPCDFLSFVSDHTTIHEWERITTPSRHISGSSCNNSCADETFYMEGFDSTGRARPLSQPPLSREAQPQDELNHVDVSSDSEGLVTERQILTWARGVRAWECICIGLSSPSSLVQVSEGICKGLELLRGGAGVSLVLARGVEIIFVFLYIPSLLSC